MRANLSHVIEFVADMERAVTYRDVIGLPLKFQSRTISLRLFSIVTGRNEDPLVETALRGQQPSDFRESRLLQDRL